MKIDLDETDTKYQMELCEVQASKFYQLKKETSAYLNFIKNQNWPTNCFQKNWPKFIVSFKKYGNVLNLILVLKISIANLSQ